MNLKPHELTAHRDPDKPPSQAQLTNASRTRKRVVDALDSITLQLAESETSQRTQLPSKGYKRPSTNNFLHIYMLPLKSLPKILKHTIAHGLGSSERSHLNGKPTSALASIKYNDINNASQVSGSSAVSTLEAKAKTLRETLMVLEKQLFLVKEQVADANKRRKFDEASSLAQNVEDLSKEIDHVQGQLGQLDFAGAYSAQSPSMIPAS